MEFDDAGISLHFGLPPDEWPMYLVHLGDDFRPLDKRQDFLGGVPNRLSQHEVTYPLIGAIQAATRARPAVLWEEPKHGRGTIPLRPDATSTATFGEVVRSRRSALDFIGGS